jgi:hypothetical protein
MSCPVTFNKKSENPFKGLRKCLELANANYVTEFMLDDAYAEVFMDKDKKALFYSIIFNIGDITNREHNIFRKNKVDGGGQAERENFYTCLNWMIKTDYAQFVKFLNAGLFNEYTCFDHLFRNRISTVKNSTTINGQYHMLANPQYREDLANYVVSVINGNNPFNKTLIAKFLTLPRFGKRSGHSRMLPETYEVMKDKADFLALLSQKMGWDYQLTPTYCRFDGYRTWRKQYNSDLESVLFSTGKILEFDELEFKNWLNKLPSQARFRVKNRVTYSVKNKGSMDLKWPVLNKWFVEWEQYKASMQEEQRKLEEKVRQGIASLEDQEKLERVKKEAKVTVGANNFKTIYEDICDGKIDWLKVESFLNKINLEYNNLVIVDESGSMTGAPYNFATFLASIMLVKNPDDFGRNMLFTFSHGCRLHSAINLEAGDKPSNRFWGRCESRQIPSQPFVIPEKSFKENYQRIDSYMRAAFESGGTYPETIATWFAQEFKSNPDLIDELKNYPVITIISDGDFSNSLGAKRAILDFQKIMEENVGFCPFIILMEVTGRSYTDARKFEGVDNFLWINSNPAQIEQVLVNFKDIDMMDVYASLQSMFRSNRYAPVRENIL